MIRVSQHYPYQRERRPTRQHRTCRRRPLPRFCFDTKELLPTPISILGTTLFISRRGTITEHFQCEGPAPSFTQKIGQETVGDEWNCDL